MDEQIKAILPKPEIEGEGTVLYRCDACGEEIHDRPQFSDGVTASWVPPDPLTAEIKTYHVEHLPEGVTVGR